MGAAELDGARPNDSEAARDVAALLPMVRRIVFARVQNHAAAEDLVQETLVKVLAAANRIEPGMLEPYAITTARHLIASMWRSQDTQRRNQHRVVEVENGEAPDERLLQEEERAAISAALEHLSEREQRMLLAHEVSGQGTRSLRPSSTRRPARWRRSSTGRGRGCGWSTCGPIRCRTANRPLSGRALRPLWRGPAPPARGRGRSAPFGV